MGRPRAIHRPSYVDAGKMETMNDAPGAAPGPASSPPSELAAKGRVLVVDDDSALVELIAIVLRQNGFQGRMEDAWRRALEAIPAARPDLVLLDLMLPGTTASRSQGVRAEAAVPIVMLTAKAETIDVVLGLPLGADDYVAKPFKPKELVARIRARIRRFDTPAQEALSIGDLDIDVAGHSVTRAGDLINLTPLEFDLLVGGPDPAAGLHP